jgi:hypothetical protein
MRFLESHSLESLNNLWNRGVDRLFEVVVLVKWLSNRRVAIEINSF